MAIAAVLIAGCGSPAPSGPPPGIPKKSPLATAAPSATLPKDGEEVAVLVTNKGRIVLRLFPDKAPKTVDNFKKLVRQKFYDGLLFHRVVPKFVIQSGCPNTRTEDRRTYGMGGPGYTIPLEKTDLSHDRGVLGMARGEEPNSAGSQFFISVLPQPELNPSDKEPGYCAFGIVLEGMNAVDRISNLPRDSRDVPNAENPAIIETATIQTWPVPPAQ